MISGFEKWQTRMDLNNWPCCLVSSFQSSYYLFFYFQSLQFEFFKVDNLEREAPFSLTRTSSSSASASSLLRTPAAQVLRVFLPPLGLPVLISICLTNNPFNCTNIEMFFDDIRYQPISSGSIMRVARGFSKSSLTASPRFVLNILYSSVGVSPLYGAMSCS